MKTIKYFAFLILAILILISCESHSNIDDSSSIIGNWIWVESSGGIAGETNTPESTGNQIELEINKYTVKRFENGELMSELAYKIEISESIRSTEKIEMIVYENDWKQSFEKHGKKLYLYDECYDCFQNEYIMK